VHPAPDARAIADGMGDFLSAQHKPRFGVEIARAGHKLIAHERRLLADGEDAIERVRLRAEKKTMLLIGVMKVSLG